MESIDINHVALIWLILSAVFFVLEVSLVPGIGFLFEGLAAITVGGLINFDIINSNSYFEQFAYFFGLIFAWAAVLWYPLKKFRSESKGDFKNIVGDSAIVCGKTLDKRKTGKVKWSGTIMNARLFDGDEKESVEKDDEVYVREINGNVLTVTSDINNTKSNQGDE
ncbi:MAG: hypothetical protein COV35_07525 [Alphaproteobacteria bacterium CG11_big_fil_rev_8_21_14_0_20_39_49]|nr:MAG: hypothetical protein COV35_07525 [Alphaproteobacteria bacterium CG11_big_fil_rev_8_21_14_0_20_39_49]